MSPSSWIVFSILGVAGLVLCEWRGVRAGVWVCKPLASLGFVATAVTGGAAQSPFGRGVLAALVASWVGDVLLIPKNQRIFKAGIASFLLGHVFYMVSFFGVKGEWTYGLVAALVVTPVSAGIARWLLPKVPGGLKPAVALYIIVISGMVVSASWASPKDPTHLLLPAAVAFFLSDLSVARDRFVKKEFLNRAWGLPLYYGAQLTLAWIAGLPT